jgi:hypothetical protein
VSKLVTIKVESWSFLRLRRQHHVRTLLGIWSSVSLTVGTHAPQGYGSRSVCLLPRNLLPTAPRLYVGIRNKVSRVLYGAFVMRPSLKTLRSRVIASFAGHRRFLAPYGVLSMFP